MMRRSLPAPALVVVLAAGLAAAQESSALVGHRVVVKYRQPLTIGGVTVEPKDYRAYKVERVNGDWLWVSSGGVAGWVPRDQVMTLDEALDFYTGEIERNPTAWNAHLYRGFVWDLRHDYTRAIADYTSAIRIYPLWANTFNNRGWTYHRMKAYDKAIADYNEAIRLDPKCVLAIVNRGFARQDKGEYYKAIVDFDRALKMDPSYARAHVSKAWLYATCPDKKFRDGKLAVRSATKACQLSHWKDPAKLAVLAAAYAESGDFDKAVKWQQQAVDRYLDPEDRRLGRERLALFEQEEPYRMPSGPGGAAATKDDPWAQFADPDRALRIFAELEDRVGAPPQGDGDEGPEARERKIDAAIQQVSRKHHMKPKDVKAIWKAGTDRDGV